MVAADAHNLPSHIMAHKACIEQMCAGPTAHKQWPPGWNKLLSSIHATCLSLGHLVTALHVSIRLYIYLTCPCLPGPALTSCLPSQPSDTSSVVSESSGT